jgi:hypothetical protein
MAKEGDAVSISMVTLGKQKNTFSDREYDDFI